MKTKYDVVIVGAGLFGRVAADLCVENGLSVIVLDEYNELAGSAPAACLMKPSWLSGLGAKGKIGLRVLHDLYTLEDIDFNMRVGQAKVHHVHPLKILRQGEKYVRQARVVEVGDGWVETSKGERYQGKVLVAAGAWSDKLVVMPRIKPLMGKCAWFPMVPGHEPRITIWAPYKQSVSFNYGKSLDHKSNLIWFGDGTAILAHNYKPEHDKRLLKHAAEHGLKKSNFLGFRAGIRPYVEGHSKGYFQRVSPNTYVSTGGGKNGVVLAGYQSQKFLEAIT